MTCQQCSAPCQGDLCKQCEIENAHAHLLDDDTEGGDDA